MPAGCQAMQEGSGEGEEVLQQPEASWHSGTKSQKPTEAMVGTGHKANC